MANRSELLFQTAAMRRFRGDFMALVGVGFIFALLLPALFAPLLANGVPLLEWGGGTFRLPFLRSFFAPPSSERTVESVFNYGLLLLLTWGIAFAALRRCGARTRATILTAVAILTALPFFLTSSRMDGTDYRAREQGSGIHFVFAPIPYGPAELVGRPCEKPSAVHWLGTDDIGRSVASRMLYGARVSLFVGIVATTMSLVIGTAFGLMMGYFRGTFDLLAMRFVELLMCFPTFLLLLILMSMFKDRKFEQSILIVIGVIGLTGWIGLAQLVRGEVLKQRAMPYITACESIGVSAWRIMTRHLLPNISGPIFISFSFGVAGAILAESSLSFLGFGVQPPTASWGGLLRQAFADPLSYWHLTFFPGLALFLAVCGFNFAGEGMRRALNPRE